MLYDKSLERDSWFRPHRRQQGRPAPQGSANRRYAHWPTHAPWRSPCRWKNRRRLRSAAANAIVSSASLPKSAAGVQPKATPLHASLNKDPGLAKAARRIVEEELQLGTLSIVGWRDAPTERRASRRNRLPSLPRIQQIFVDAARWRPRDIERRLFTARRRIEKRLQEDEEFVAVPEACPIWSTSIKVCVCRGLPRFDLDLADLRRSRRSACSTSASPPTPYHAGRWRRPLPGA